MVPSGIFVDCRLLDTSGILARLNQCRQTVWASDRGLGGFEADARIADGRWEALDASDASSVLSREPRFVHNVVALVGIAPAHLQQLRSLVEPLRDPARKAEARRELKETALAVAGELPCKAGWKLESEPTYVGVYQGPGGEPHTTVNENTGLRVGLHIDSFDRLAPTERRSATNRLCINLGLGQRALQFVPREVVSFPDALEARGIRTQLPDSMPTHDGRRLDLARSFLLAYAESAVLRLRLEPGEGYIAPTENLIHDGSSEGACSPDVTLTIRARFVPHAR